MFRKEKSLWLFLFPGLLLLLIFYIVPFFSGISYSITDGSKTNTYVGLTNYLTLWKNKMFLLGLKNTLELSVISAPLLWGIAFLLALILQSIQPKGSFFRSASLLPYLAPSSAMLLIWLIMFDYGGPLNRIVGGMGFERIMWLESSALRTPIILMFGMFLLVSSIAFVVLAFAMNQLTAPALVFTDWIPDNLVSIGSYMSRFWTIHQGNAKAISYMTREMSTISLASWLIRWGMFTILGSYLVLIRIGRKTK